MIIKEDVKRGTVINSLEASFTAPLDELAFKTNTEDREVFWVESYDGRYVVSRFLNEGTDPIFAGFDRKFGRDVAIKISRICIDEPDEFSAIRYEGIATARFDHPNVIRVYDITLLKDETISGRYYPVLVEELVNGKDLRQLILDKPLDLETANYLMQKFSKGIDYIHSKGYIHRDIKPSNIVAYLDESGEQPEVNVKIIDNALSIRKNLEEPLSAVSGSLEFMSKDILSGEIPRDYDDYWASLVTLYAIIAGYYPFDISKSDELSEYKKLTKRTKFLIKHGIKKTKKLDAFFENAFAKYKQYASFKEIMDEFQNTIRN